MVPICKQATSRQSIQDIAFRNPIHPGLGLESISLKQLITRVSEGHLARPMRPDFSVRLLYTAGRGQHIVNSVAYPVKSGTLITVPPGHVHQFCLNPSLEGQLIVVDSAFMLPKHLAYAQALMSLERVAICRDLTEDLCEEFLAVAAKIASESDRYGTNPLASTLLRQRLNAMTLLLHMSAEPDDLGVEDALQGHELVGQFLGLLEKRYKERWSVQDYACRLGYSEKTLTRACLSWSGKSAKALIDARIILEAKRALAHSNETVAAIFLRLGFEDGGNFVRFFKRHEGVTPAVFRQVHAHRSLALS